MQRRKFNTSIVLEFLFSTYIIILFINISSSLFGSCYSICLIRVLHCLMVFASFPFVYSEPVHSVHSQLQKRNNSDNWNFKMIHFNSEFTFEQMKYERRKESATTTSKRFFHRRIKRAHSWSWIRAIFYHFDPCITFTITAICT